MTVLLLAPVGLDHRSWRWLELTGVDCLTHDFPGFGGRHRQPERATMSDWVDDVAEAVQAAGRWPVDIVGCSLGAMVAMHLATRRPELVSSLLLACTGASADPETMQERAQRVERQGMEGVLPETLERWFTTRALSQVPVSAGIAYARATLLALEPGAFADGWRVVAGHNATADLASVAVPTTCVAAQEDQAASLDRVRALATSIHGARLVVVPGPHMAFLEEPSAFQQAVAQHLDWVNTTLPRLEPPSSSEIALG